MEIGIVQVFFYSNDFTTSPFDLFDSYQYVGCS